MNEIDADIPRISRRALLGGIAGGTATLALGGNTRARQMTPGMMTMEQLVATIRDAMHPDEPIAALAEVFARSGIAVFDDAVTALQVPLKAPPSPLSFTTSQVASMAEELRSRSYRLAGAWNGFGPETAESGEPMPLASDFYAGYGWQAATPGGDFVRQLIWEMPIGNGSMASAGLPAPRAAMAVMSGEILGGLQWQLEGVPTHVPGIPDIPSLPGLPQLPPLPKLYELPPLPELNNQVCANVQTFVTSVIQRVLSVLENTRDAVTIPILDQILAGFLGAIDFGLKVIVRAIDLVIAPAMAVLKSIAAAVAIASTILGTVTPWTISAIAAPDRTRRGIGPIEVISGEVAIVAGGADDLPWPEVVTGCASALGLQVPQRTSAGAAVTVEIQNPSDLVLVELGQEARVLDTAGKLAITYVTTNEPQGAVDAGDEEIGVVYITTSIDREDLRQFSKQLIDLLLAELPTIIADVLRNLTMPVVNDLRENLLRLTVAQATTRMYVTYHREHCLLGEFMVMNMSTFLAAHTPNVIAATGRIHWWFNHDGACSMSWNGVKAQFDHGGSSVYSGVAEGTFTVENGVVSIIFSSSNAQEVASHPDIDDHMFYLDAPWLTTEFGSWTLACGDTIYLGNPAQRYVMWLGPVVP